MADIEGVIPAIPTPMTPEGGVNETALRAVIEFNIQAGVNGLWIAGGAGESILLDDDENMRIAEIASSQSKGRANIIMHVGAATTTRAMKLAEHAATQGVQALCCVPPFFYGQDDDGIVEFYRAVASVSDLPFFIYNLPEATGIEITPDLAHKLQDAVPQLTGLKHSALIFDNIRIFANMGLVVLNGFGTLMLPALVAGAAGCVDGPLSMAPELWVDAWNAYQAGDMDKAKKAEKRAIEIFGLILDFGYHQTLKTVLSERLGIDCGAPRLPTLPLSSEQNKALLSRVNSLELNKVSVT
jgi:dihydrodipicolinate synthase/N-acetylneuraminate lyase